MSWHLAGLAGIPRSSVCGKSKSIESTKPGAIPARRFVHGTNLSPDMVAKWAAAYELAGWVRTPSPEYLDRDASARRLRSLLMRVYPEEVN